MDFRFALDFLTGLKKNNNREWFNRHRKDWDKVKTDFSSFTEVLIRGISSFDPSVGALEPKHCIFRLNRDIRFSADKSPYKTHAGAYIAEGGRKSPKAGYYFHLEPSGSFAGGGIWMPPAEVLSKVREEIDYCGEEFEGLVNARSFRRYFPELQGECLKTAPKGYPKDHAHISFLRMKSFTVSFRLDDKQVTGEGLENICLEVYREMQPLIRFFNRAFDQ